jgi:uncharacterized protein (TIGR02118 family)
MHRLTIQYAAPADAAEFDAHYRDVHVPLVLAVPGLRRFTMSHPRPLGGGLELHLVAELWFDDADALKTALKSPEMADTAADAGTFDVASMTMFTGAVEEITGRP